MPEFEPQSFQTNAEMDRSPLFKPKRRTKSTTNLGGSVNCHFALQHIASGRYYVNTLPRTELHSFSTKLRDAMVCNKESFIIRMAMDLRGRRWMDYYRVVNIKVRKVSEEEFINNRHPNWKDRIEGATTLEGAI